ncbi:MAG TPA: hypothetical protein VNB49_16105 [Candidatus Dormibacteraeota bacterium]|nr:hypothetical protein [Candidatus Dormibacteraeota bacterium]
MTEEQSRDVFARWSETDVAKLPLVSAELMRKCGRLPLALSIVSAMLRGKPLAIWKTVLDHLCMADLEKIKAQFPDYPHPNLLKTIQVGVDALDETARERYLALAVLLEEMGAAPQVQQCLWGVDEGEAAETAEQFVSLCLAQRDQPEGSIRLHDLQLDYVRSRYPGREALDLIHGAVGLSSHVIAKDPSQFASQMVGRLLPHQDVPVIKLFTARVVKGAPKPWLRPLQRALDPSGTSLVRTLEGHSERSAGHQLFSCWNSQHSILLMR